MVDDISLLRNYGLRGIIFMTVYAYYIRFPVILDG
jgi:hypothetical protein